MINSYSLATDVLIEDGVNGRLFSADDEDGLAEILRQLVADERCAQALGARARQTVVARYDIERTAQEWLDAYETVSGSGG